MTTNISYSYYNPVETIFGVHAFKKILPTIQKYVQNNHILIVSDENLLNILGIHENLHTLLKANGYTADFFEKPGKYSSISIIDRGAERVRKHQYGLIIGIGGGSAMDTAKCMAILGRNNGSINDYLKKGKSLEKTGVPLILVPTTAGTGSEVTRWATVWDLGDFFKKFSLSDPKMFAKASIIDPTLLLKLPPKMSAMTGLDALSQAIEAYWSKNHNPVSDEFALKSIELILENITKMFHNPSDLSYRTQMALGSMFSGLAFSNTKTTAVHSVSYPMTLHFNIPHGLACALTLGEFIKFNALETPNNTLEAPQRLQTIISLFKTKTAEEAALKLTMIMKEMALETKLSQFNIDENGIEKIIAEGFTPDRVKHNPRLVTKEDLREILHNIK
ncbi:hypothetical protein NEF87_004217 [Candidatus Lokiarchaeum ossiferum]|uniref:Iron-containing alcohol dehydrogenase n=1 Tax=Candidatus Lokiarchaeum ossiferum TaxID=2951803 RepID=A0ABY6I025_9ARCH|nr:hypothetical protein NEF87_004217 [Candidatus Lokiarchaeum sp. B-35]